MCIFVLWKKNPIPMNLLSVEGISKSYGEKIIFKPLSFGINKGQKIALIAKNGSGKTSILNIIAGEDTPDEGNVVYRKGTRVAYLAQEPKLDAKLTVEESILQADNPTLKIIANKKLKKVILAFCLHLYFLPKKKGMLSLLFMHFVGKSMI